MKEDRNNDIEYDYKNYFSYTTILNIPEGYKVDYIPKNVSVTNNLLTSNITYTSKNNSITYKHDVSFNFITLNLKQQEEINSMVKTIEKADKEVIVLKKNN